MHHPPPDTAAPMLDTPVKPLILKTALPSMGAMIASGLCTLLDALLLGRCGAQATAAVSVCFPLLTMIQTIGFTLGMGGGSAVSRSLGGGSREDAQRAANASGTLALMISVLFCGAGAVFARAAVRLLGANDALLPDAAAYARWLFASGPLLCMNLLLSSLMRGQGKTLPNLAAFSGGAAIGAALQYLLVLVLGFGVRGSGAAMLIREALTLVILLLFLFHDSSFIRPRLTATSLRPAALAGVMRFGLPTLVRQGLASVSAALLSRAGTALGETALAGMGLAVRSVSLVSSAVIGFGQGFAPVCGFALGAGNAGRAAHAYRFCLRCVVLALAGVGAAVFAFARPLLSFFGHAPEVVAFGEAALRAQSAVFFAQGAVIIMNMFTQASGQTVRATLVAASRQGYVFIPLVLILPRFFGSAGLILCQSASDLISLALSWALTRSTIKGFSCAREEYSDVRTGSQ